jgi:hypothetical protein
MLKVEEFSQSPTLSGLGTDITHLPKAPGDTEAFSLTTNPLTAGLEAAASFFNFLCTPEGQKVVEDIRQIDIAFVTKVSEVFSKIHATITK